MQDGHCPHQPGTPVSSRPHTDGLFPPAANRRGAMAGRTDGQTLRVPCSAPPPTAPLALLLPPGSHRALVGSMATAGRHVQVMWPRRDWPRLHQVFGGSAEEVLSLSQTCLSGSSPPPGSGSTRLAGLLRPACPSFCPQGDPRCFGQCPPWLGCLHSWRQEAVGRSAGHGPHCCVAPGTAPAVPYQCHLAMHGGDPDLGADPLAHPCCCQTSGKLGRGAPPSLGCWSN